MAGFEPGPLTDELLDAAVASGALETQDLDWKSAFPDMKGLASTDFPKDIAAMANSGGGVIVYGVEEKGRAATNRVDVGEISEQHERALRSVAVTAISPPIFGLKVHRLGQDRNRALVIEVPTSDEGPHLVFKQDYFGAPIRNDSDTVWMKERQIDEMYRARFNRNRDLRDNLDELLREMIAGRDTSARAWLIAVAVPRFGRTQERMSQQTIRTIVKDTEDLTCRYVKKQAFHALANVDLDAPRPGLRRWVLPNQRESAKTKWRESWASVHDNGSVTLAVAIGAHMKNDGGYLNGWEVDSSGIEGSIADFMAMIRATAKSTHNTEYSLKVKICWSGDQPLSLLVRGRFEDYISEDATPLYYFTPVEFSIDATESELDFHSHVRDLALDCVNQGGINYLYYIRSSQIPDEPT